jgi:cysteine desulfurase/selenocysteine lyase
MRNEKQIRKQYAFFKKNKEIYFDNNSSSLKPNCVREAVNYYNAYVSTNPGRGVYKLGHYVTQKIAEVRQKVAHLIGAQENEVVFTKNATEALNIVALSYAQKHLNKGDEVLVSLLDHHSLLLPLLEVANKVGAKLVYVPLDKNHKLTLKNFKSKLSKKTKLVALTYVSNVTGASIDAKQFVKSAHEVGASVILDAAQAVPHKKVDVKHLDCDFLAFSGYKMGAPTGVGVLYGKQNLLAQMEPVYYGGGMVLDSVVSPIEYKPAPDKFEGGTQSAGDIIGLGAAIDFLQTIGYDNIEQKEKELTAYLYEKLSSVDGVELYNKNPDIPTLIFNIKGVHAHDTASLYDMYDICVRAGHNCVQPFLQHLNQISVVRVSLCFYNTKKEIDTFIETTKKIVAYFKQF